MVLIKWELIFIKYQYWLFLFPFWVFLKTAFLYVAQAGPHYVDQDSPKHTEIHMPLPL